MRALERYNSLQWLALLLLGITGVSGCSSASVAAKVAGNIAMAALGIPRSEAPAGPPPPVVVQMHIEGGKNLNADSIGRPLSAIVRIYRLRAAEAFLGAPYASFGRTDREKESFGADLIAVKEFVLSPGQSIDIDEKLEPEVTYLGIVTVFRAPAPQRWRFAFAQSDLEKKTLNLGVHACAMTATTVAPIGTKLSEVSRLSSVRCDTPASVATGT